MFQEKNSRQFPAATAQADNESDPVGFTLYEPMVCLPGKEQSATRVQLLVPAHRLEELEAVEEDKERLRQDIVRAQVLAERAANEQRRLEARLKSEKEAEEAEAKEAREAKDEVDFEEAARAAGKGSKVSPTPSKIDTSNPPPQLKAVIESEDYSPARQHPVYSPDAPQLMYSRAQLAPGEKELKKRDLDLCHQLANRGVLRRVAAPEGMEALDALYDSHPNFEEVIDLVKNQLLLAERSGRAPRIPPILLDGEPGLGKTHFASALAQVLGAPIQRIAMDASVTAAKLVGTDRHWSNTAVGSLFEIVCLGTHANPVFLLDEVDKAVGRNYQDPLAALHSLLEPSTACRAKDVSAEMEFDASLVTWVATANHARLLPDSLRSRFREFRIKRLTAEQSIRATESIVESTVDDLELAGFEVPGRAFCVALAHLVPREIQQAVQQAVAVAVANGKTRVTVKDIPAQFRDDESKPAGGNSWLH